MGGFNLSTMLLLVLAALLVSAGIQDARTREIANWKNAAIALLAPLWWWANSLGWLAMAEQLGIALLVFAVFVAAFHFGWMGGGDVKMIGALALWMLDPIALIWMLIVMSLVGGALTAILLVERALRRRTAQIEVPYGVAIAIAALLALREPLFNHFGVNA
ncbi:MAG: prepilin peptidase [Sphingomonas sp.]|jgi:prepilin peptidase CpaA|uniref:A24 family peptidase n=1 Tax=Sphingomonas sp. TaxID=28214 RepID=UPI00356941EF